MRTTILALSFNCLFVGCFSDQCYIPRQSLDGTRGIAKTPYVVVEAYPIRMKAVTDRQALILEPAAARVHVPPSAHSSRLSYVITTMKTWPVGHKLTVAFSGGSKELRTQIAEAAAEWTAIKDKDGKSGSISLDFGDSATFREWTSGDTAYSADIRIAFDTEEEADKGYWSAVGDDSIARASHPPNQASMMLYGFSHHLPAGWKATVMHEFGHAFGFQHEHQNPKCPCDFRWEDEPGYEKTQNPSSGEFVSDNKGRNPGVYTILGGHPNKWPRDRVDANLRQLPHVDAFEASAIDRNSIMKYYFPAYLFASGSKSPCFSKTIPVELSRFDKEGFLISYPAISSDIDKQRRLSVLKMALDAVNNSASVAGDAPSIQVELRERISGKISLLQ